MDGRAGGSGARGGEKKKKKKKKKNGRSALVSMIALTNFFNRVNTTLRVQPGSWG